MAEDVIKTTSCSDAMMGSMLGSMVKGNGTGNAMEMLAAMNGGMGANSWINNPWIYFVFLAMFGNGGFGFGGNRGNAVQDAEIQAKLNQLSNQMQEGNNTNLLMDAIKGNANAVNQLASNLNCDFNALNGAICDVRQGISTLSGQVGYSAERVINAINLGDMNLIQQLKDCCCQTQQNIIKMGYEQQLGQKDIQNAMQQGFSYTNTGLERGFSNIGNLLQSIACDLKTTSNANRQAIIDKINDDRYQDVLHRAQRAEFEISQRNQNATIIAALKTTGTTTTGA